MFGKTIPKRPEARSGGIVVKTAITDDTQKAMMEWNRLQQIEDNGRENSMRQLKEDAKAETHLNALLRQCSVKNFKWHGVPKLKPLHEKYNVKEGDITWERPRKLNVLLLEAEKEPAVAAAYLIKRAAHGLHIPCSVDVTFFVAEFVANIMRGVHATGEAYNLLFIPMFIENVFGPTLMRSLFEYGTEIPVVLCTKEPPSDHRQQLLDSAHLRQTLERDELESRTSKANRKPWTSLPLPYTKEKLAMLIMSWWNPTQNRLQRHRQRAAETRSMRKSRKTSAGTKYPSDPLNEPEAHRTKTPVELAMEPGKQPPRANELIKRSASYVMRYPLVNGLGVHGTIRAYSSKQYDLPGSLATNLKLTWEQELEQSLRGLPDDNARREALRKGGRLVDPSKNPDCRKMMAYLNKTKTQVQNTHKTRLRDQSFRTQASEISAFLPFYSGHNQRAGVGKSRRQGRNRAHAKKKTLPVTSQMTKMKNVNNACGYHPIHPLKGYAQSWDFQFDKGADEVKEFTW